MAARFPCPNGSGRPLTPLELHTLRLHVDQNFIPYQHRQLPPPLILELLERYRATVGQPQNTPPPTTTSSLTVGPAPEPRRSSWRDLLRWEVRLEAIVVGVIIGLIIPVVATFFLK